MIILNLARSLLAAAIPCGCIGNPCGRQEPLQDSVDLNRTIERFQAALHLLLSDNLEGNKAPLVLSVCREAAPVYAREKLPLDAAFDGPAILEQLDCTTVVEPGDRVTQDKLGNLLISVRA